MRRHPEACIAMLLGAIVLTGSGPAPHARGAPRPSNAPRAVATTPAAETTAELPLSEADSAALAAALVLFLPWSETPPPLPKDPGDSKDPGNSKDPKDSGDPPFTHNPEPATLISGALGAGLLALAGWRRRRSQLN